MLIIWKEGILIKFEVFIICIIKIVYSKWLTQTSFELTGKCIDYYFSNSYTYKHTLDNCKNTCENDGACRGIQYQAKTVECVIFTVNSSVPNFKFTIGKNIYVPLGKGDGENKDWQCFIYEPDYCGTREAITCETLYFTNACDIMDDSCHKYLSCIHNSNCSEKPCGLGLWSVNGYNMPNNGCKQCTICEQYQQPCNNKEDAICLIDNNCKYCTKCFINEHEGICSSKGSCIIGHLSECTPSKEIDSEENSTNKMFYSATVMIITGLVIMFVLLAIFIIIQSCWKKHSKTDLTSQFIYDRRRDLL